MKTSWQWEIVISFIIFILVSCAPITPSKTPVPSHVPTPCLPITPVPVNLTPTSVPPQQSTHFFVLVDISGSFSDYYSISLSILNDSLSQLLQPGDRLTIAWLGSNSGQATEKFFDEKSSLPNIPSSKFKEHPPMPVKPTFIETPTMRSDGTTMDNIESRQTAEAIVELNLYNENKYYCEIFEWNQNILNSENDLHLSPGNHEFEEFIKRASQAIQKAKNADVQGFTDIYSALWDVSEVYAVDRATNQFQRFVLIMFSDMEGNVIHQNVKNSIDLSKTHVIVANYPCGKPNVCQEEMDNWKKTFELNFGAEVANILRPEDTLIQPLVYLSRR